MVVSRRIATGQSGCHELSAKVLSARISTLKPPSGHHDRAELIRDVVDGFRRLRGSVLRFILLFANGEAAAVQRKNGARSLRALLSILAREAQAARFDRLRELKLAIRHARLLEKTREAVFSDSFCDDPVAMRKTAAELERVDAVLVGLCVEHVLERHFKTPGPTRHSATTGAERVPSQALQPTEAAIR
ncbi:MAG TPA: hypothetical protein VGL08_11560 [Paraburkholderia sp.]